MATFDDDNSSNPAPPPGAESPPEWYDLATNRAGQAAREQAIAARKERPINTLLARVLSVHTDERAWRVGADGEEQVGWRLGKLGEQCRVLHSVPVGTGDSDIDHIVIGPGGVFTLKTKAHPRARVSVAEKSLLVNGKCTPCATPSTKLRVPPRCSAPLTGSPSRSRRSIKWPAARPHGRP